MEKHELLREQLLSDIAELDPHTKIPPERELAERYHVSRGTVRQALDDLEEIGTLYRVQGAGTFVAGPHVSKTLLLSSFSEDMRARGMQPGSRVLAAGEVPADAATSENLQVSVGESLVRLVRLRLADGFPMCLETVYMPAKLVPGLLNHDLTGSLYALLEAHYGLRLSRADQRLEAVVVSGTEAGLLGVPPGAPALRIQRVGLNERDHPLECTTSIYRADRYDIRFAVRRG